VVANCDRTGEDLHMGPTLEHTDPATTRRGLFTRPVTIVALVAVAAIGAIGAFVAVDLATRDHDERTTVFDDPVVAVDADVSAGSLHIVGTDDPQVTVIRKTRSGVIGPDRHEAVRDGRLVIRSDCASGLFAPSCRVDYEVRVPADVAVRARTSGGTARVEGIVGDVDARSNGGKVTLTYGSAPQHLKAATNGGQVIVEVPDGPETYAVDADADGGSAKVEVRTDPRSDRVIDAHANGGTVTVRYAS
jgi:hypothetical protein